MCYFCRNNLEVPQFYSAPPPAAILLRPLQLAVSGSGYCKLANSLDKNLKGGLGFDSVDCTVRVWDLDSGQEIACFDGHKMPVTTVAFSPDGRRILSGGYDNTVRLWDIETSKEVICYSEHTGPVNSVVFSPDGRLAVSGSRDRTVRVWKLPEPIEVVKADVAERGDDKGGKGTQPSAAPKRPESKDQHRLTIRRSEITQIAPAVSTIPQRIRLWFIQDGGLKVNTAGDENFLWVVAGVKQSGVKKDVPKLSIKDVNDNEVGLFYAWIDASDYRHLLPNPFLVIKFVDENNTQVTEGLRMLYDLAFGYIWTVPRRDVLLIFKGKYRAGEDLYLDGPNIHALLHIGRRSSGRSISPRRPEVIRSRQNIDRNNTRSTRERRKRTSTRDGMR